MAKPVPLVLSGPCTLTYYQCLTFQGTKIKIHSFVTVSWVSLGYTGIYSKVDAHGIIHAWRYMRQEKESLREKKSISATLDINEKACAHEENDIKMSL